MFICFIYEVMKCWVVFFWSHPQMPYYSPILSSVFVNEAPRALITKTKKQSIMRAGGDTFKTPIFLPHV